MPYGNIGCTYHELKYSSPNRSQKTQKARAIQKSLPFGKWRFRGKEAKRMGQKQKKIRQKQQQDIRTKEEI